MVAGNTPNLHHVA
jgi:hypothetical protein